MSSPEKRDVSGMDLVTSTYSRRGKKQVPYSTKDYGPVSRECVFEV